ncbi:MAG: sugar MFS transporter [Verrucomicrobiota bacterium JB023]|nr:sugar MFS transporter [Verrucomicrobiota bacterium JB023]
MSQHTTTQGSNHFAFATVTSLFFMWGFISCMNDLLIPKFKAEFELSQFQANLVQSFFFGAYCLVSLAYFLISAAKGDPINKIGYKNGLIIGLILTAGACMVFVPAANTASYPLFLVALCLLGSGVTLIQIAANPYISILGPESSASSRLNLSQGLNSLGYVLTPLIGGALIFQSATGEGGLDTVKAPYVGLAVILLAIAIAIKFIKLPTFRQEGHVEAGIKVFRHKHFAWGMAAIFFYVGAEVTVGSILVNYLEKIMNFTEEQGVKYLSFYWGGLMIGRLMGAISLSGLQQAKKFPMMVVAALVSIFIIFLSAKGKSDLTVGEIWPYFITVVLSFVFFRLGRALPGRMVGLFAIVATVLSLLAMTTSGEFALWSIVGIGLFNSIMWSNIFTLSIRGLGEDTSQGSSLLVMMICGGALLPLIQGGLMDFFGVRASLSIVLISYLYLAYFGFVGSKIGRESEDEQTA